MMVIGHVHNYVLWNELPVTNNVFSPLIKLDKGTLILEQRGFFYKLEWIYVGVTIWL
jgi:hypothetical protein